MRDRNQPSVILELLRASDSWRSISPTWLGAPGGFVEQMPQTDVRFDSDEIECMDLPCSGSPTSGSSLLCNLNRIRRWLHPAKWFMPRATVPPGMQVYVEPGIAYWGGTTGSPAVWLGGTSGSFAHNSGSDPRIDILFFNASTGALGIQQGTPAPIPVPPWPLSGSPFPITEIYMRPCSGSIFNLCSSGSSSDNYIYRDVRPFITTGGGGGVTDHGNLAGLADDDHPQYLLATGTRAGASAQAQDFGTNGIKADVIAESTGAAGVTIDSCLVKDGYVLTLDGAVGTPAHTFQTDPSTGMYLESAGRLMFTTAGVQALEIDASQVLWIGSTKDTNLYRSAANVLRTDDDFRAARLGLGVNPSTHLDLLAALEDYVTMRAVTKSNAQVWHASRFNFRRARTSAGVGAIVQNGDLLGSYIFEGYDGDSYETAATIGARVDGAPGDGDMPGRLEFSTSLDGTSAPAERLRIDNAGKVWFGPGAGLDTNLYRSAANVLKTDDAFRADGGLGVNVNPGGWGLNILGTAEAGSSSNYTRSSNDVGGATFNIRKTRGAIVQNNDYLGSFAFRGYDGAAYQIGAQISTRVDGVPGLNDMPCRLAFYTTPGGAAAPVERLRIDNAGKVWFDRGGAGALDTNLYRSAANVLKTDDAFVAGGVIRGATSLWWHAYCVDAVSMSPGASAATWVDADANHLAGYQLNAADEYLYMTACVHNDWDGASDIELKVTFEILAAGAVGTDTVDIAARCYYKGTGDTATKTQTPEIAVTVGAAAQFTQFVATILIDHDLGGQLVDVGDKMSIRINLETDTSEVDDILVSHVNFRYKTAKMNPEV